MEDIIPSRRFKKFSSVTKLFLLFYKVSQKDFHLLILLQVVNESFFGRPCSSITISAIIPGLMLVKSFPNKLKLQAGAGL